MFYGAGSWAEYCVVSETALVAVPDNVPDEIAAQFFVSLNNTPTRRRAAVQVAARSRRTLPDEAAAQFLVRSPTPLAWLSRTHGAVVWHASQHACGASTIQGQRVPHSTSRQQAKRAHGHV
jgi:hypothetical protein